MSRQVFSLGSCQASLLMRYERVSLKKVTNINSSVILENLSALKLCRSRIHKQTVILLNKIATKWEVVFSEILIISEVFLSTYKLSSINTISTIYLYHLYLYHHLQTSKSTYLSTLFVSIHTTSSSSSFDLPIVFRLDAV